MARHCLCLALVALVGVATGCRMCASPYDYCSPTFLGGDCEDCRPLARSGSTLSDDTYVGNTSPFERATFETLTEDNEPDWVPPENHRGTIEPEPETMEAPTEAAPLPLEESAADPTEEPVAEPAEKPADKQASRWHRSRR